MTILHPAFQAFIARLQQDYDIYEMQSVNGVVVAI
jgi:hypothetical protein